MGRREELKEEFSRITGMPAKKVFASVVCLDLGKRRMQSLNDWIWAIENIKPEYCQSRIADLEARCRDHEQQSAIIEDLEARCRDHEQQSAIIEDLEARCRHLESQLKNSSSAMTENLESEADNLCAPDVEIEQMGRSIMLLPETIAIAALTAAFKESTDIKKLYLQLVKHIHPDVAVDKAKGKTIFNYLKDIYNDARKQRENYSANNVESVTRVAEEHGYGIVSDKDIASDLDGIF